MLRCIVLVKQVPDTANITGEVMKADGTVNRAKLPAVFNLEDRVALTLALQVKEQCGAHVTAVSMGPPRAVDVLRECLSLGVDATCLVTDRRFAGADTLATSYVLSRVVEQLAPYDLVFAGRQAIDGDTAQVGPQTAEKLGLPQITYVDRIQEIANGQVTARRQIEDGYELLRSPLPALLTVVREAAQPRPPSARRALIYKRARARWELEREAGPDALDQVDERAAQLHDRGLLIPTLTADDLDVDLARCGNAGSPTKVHRVRSVVVAGGEQRRVEPTHDGLREMVGQLIEDRILG